MSPVSHHPGSAEEAYAARHARQHSELHSPLRRKLHDVNGLDILLPEAGAIYVRDRG